MKWNNKEHQFDEIASRIEKEKKIMIFGAGKYGKYAYKMLNEKFKIIGFIDNDINKQNTKMYNIPIYSIDNLSCINEKFNIVVAMNIFDTREIIGKLKSYGYEENINLFQMDKFISIFGLYLKDMIYLPSISFLPTTKCNLNCRGCLNFSEFNENQKHRTLKTLKEDIDVFFKNIDYIKQFHISGGEPFMYPQIDDLLEYLGDMYRNKIFYLAITTNGTIKIKKETLRILSKYDIEVILDDYTDSLNNINRFNEIKELLEANNVKYIINKADYWVNLLPDEKISISRSEEELKDLYKKCNVPWQELRDCKIYSCNYSSYASVAGIIEEKDHDYYDLRKFDKSKKRELIEFRFGYNELGYVEFCKKCSGYIGINRNIIDVAEQVAK